MRKQKSNYVDYAYAPYNFIRLPKNIICRYDKYENLPNHNEYSKELMNGYIEYEIEAKTDIMVCSGKNENGKKTFFLNEEGKHAIPGTSIRGLIRTTSAILSSSSMGREISDAKFLYRRVAGEYSKLRKEYSERMGIKSLKNEKGKKYSLVKGLEAGYIYKKSKEEYVILPSRNDVSSVGYLRIKDNKLKELGVKEKFSAIKYFSVRNEDKRQKIEYLTVDGINCMDDKNSKNHKSNKKYKSNKNYKEYICEISFNLSFENGMPEIREIDVKGKHEYAGFLMNSGKMEGKKNHYIVFEYNDNEAEVSLGKDEINGYILDLILTKKSGKDRKIKKGKEYYDLPNKIGIKSGKPIFYTSHEGKNYFGFTPYLRISYDNSVHSGINQNYLDDSKLDYLKALFGFTSHNNDKKLTYKTRVGFEDAISNSAEEKEHTLVAGEPKATCLTNYIVQKEGEETKSYNNDDFEIRGIKQYFLKDRVSPKSAESKNVNSTIRALKKGARFKGRINFSNLHEDELGLLVWALKLENGSRHNIGHAKPYGFGQIEVKNIVTKVENLEKKYSERLTTDFYDIKNDEELVASYKKYVLDTFKRDISNDPSVKDFMFMKQKVLKGNEIISFEHMSIDNKEFKDDKYLPSVEELSREEYLRKYIDSKKKNIGGKNFGNNKKEKRVSRNKERKQDNSYDPDSPFAKLGDLNLMSRCTND